MPPVTIIMNVRNGAETLRAAIDSVLAQTCGDWELIVWDDCSSDGSAAVVSSYRDRRIRYFLAREHTSLGQARDDAIAAATGEWIAFLDQDDLWLPHKLERQLALAEPGVGLIYGRTVRFYPRGRERDYDQAHEYELLPEGDIFSQLFTRSCFIAMSSAVFRRSAIAAIGGIPGEVRIIPDYYLYVAVARQYRVRAVQEVVCRYRMHPGSMSHVSALEMHKEVLWLIDRWAGDLDPHTVALCRKRHLTAIALEEMRSRRTFRRGFVRLLTQGSPGSQLGRPFAFLMHLIRRSIRPPYWRLMGERPGV
ncbi:MAG TPA: glycosyltransferase [Candidatus Binatia bacterium]|nr:glycosyltransferase [Candidatus Binatia bacterium]